MDVGRNDPCPCGSGKKYKKCHGDMVEQQLLDPTLPTDSAINKRMGEARIRHCIHPDQNECNGKIVIAHSIQNNRILNQIGRNGEVYMMKHTATKDQSKFRFKLIGRGKATTFTGFCAHHDKTLFQPIEDRVYKGTEQQHFLFSYRTFSFEYHKKLEAQKALANAGKLKPSLVKDDQYLSHLKGHELGIRDSLYHKKVFDNALISSSYDIVETVPLIFEGESHIAVCSGFFLEYDLEGNQASGITKNIDEIAQLLMLNIIPQEDRMIVLFSWLKEFRHVYEKFKQQILSLTPEQQLKVLNNIIPCYCENVVYRPEYIENWTQSEKGTYEVLYQRIIRHPFPPEKKNLLMEPQHNLFRNIQP